MIKRIFVMLILVCAPALGQEQKYASLGDFKLESGEVIRDCRIGYRTFGTLAADKSNIILFPTWAGGTTEQLANGSIGPGSLADSSKYYVIAVDALANGVSSSPSNSTLQPRMKFPKITIRDMVNTQYALLTKVLGIQHVRAVLGTSMGGMQTFVWMTAYPEFMDKAIPIVGSPQMSAFDVLQWQTQLDSIEQNAGWKGGDYEDDPARVENEEFGMLLLTTPEHVNRTHTRQQVMDQLEKAKTTPGQDSNNKIRQTEAMMSLDVAKDFGGSLETAAKAVKAKVLVVTSRYDHVVNPESATKFAGLVSAPVLELTDDCGHLAPSCEGEKVRKAVEEFLGR